MDIVVARDFDITTILNPTSDIIRVTTPRGDMGQILNQTARLNIQRSSQKKRYWMVIPREQDIYRNRLISHAAYKVCRTMYVNNQEYILDSTLAHGVDYPIEKIGALSESAVKLLNSLEAWFLQVVEPPPLLRPDDFYYEDQV